MQSILIYIHMALLIAWLLPPVRQYRTKYFYYFLILALSDPVNYVLYKAFHVNIWYCHVIFSVLLIASLLHVNIIKKYSAVIVLLIFLSIFYVTGLSQTAVHNLVTFNIIVVIIILARDFVIDIKETEAVNIFFIVLLLYNISNVMKILFRVSFAETGYLYFFLTNFFQIFIAVYFTIYNVNNAKKISLFRDEQTT